MERNSKYYVSPTNLNICHSSPFLMVTKSIRVKSIFGMACLPEVLHIGSFRGFLIAE